MTEEQTNNKEMYVSNNEQYSDFNALQVRLNTEPILKDIEFYLKGVSEVVSFDEEGNPVIKRVSYSSPKANNEGVHSIMSFVKTRFNSQVVQGNIESFEDLLNFLSFEREDFCEFLMHNLYDWDIQEREIGGIIDIVIGQQRLFLSRLVNNGERNSYSNTIQHRESNNSTLDNRRSGFKVPGFR